MSSLEGVQWFVLIICLVGVIFGALYSYLDWERIGDWLFGNHTNDRED